MGAKRATLIVAVLMIAGFLLEWLVGIWVTVHYHFQADTMSDEAIARARLPFDLLAVNIGIVFGAWMAWLLTRKTRSETAEPNVLQQIGYRVASTRVVLVAFSLGLVIQYFTILVLWPAFDVPMLETADPVVSIYSSWWAFGQWAIMVVILAPVIEEVFFRGVLFSGIRRDYGLLIAALVVTVVFVALHIPRVGLDPPYLISLTLLSFFALATRLRSRSLAPAISLHLGYNLIVFMNELLYMIDSVA